MEIPETETVMWRAFLDYGQRFLLRTGRKEPLDVGAARTLVLTIEVAVSSGINEPVEVTMTVENPTGIAIVFCDHHTPFEGILNQIFEVRNAAGDVISYSGMMVKRAAPNPENYITVEPGKSKTAQVNLRDGFQLPAGQYTAKFKGSDISGLGDSEAVRFSVTAP